MSMLACLGRPTPLERAFESERVSNSPPLMPVLVWFASDPRRRLAATAQDQTGPQDERR